MRSGCAGVSRALVAYFLFLGPASAAVVACSSDDAAAPAKPVSAAVCPNTVKQAAGASCTQEGFSCGIGYTCVAFPQQAQCTCMHGKFACTDATGAAVQVNGDPKCVAPGAGNDAECPMSELGTMGKPCTTAGLLCHYNGALCPENMGIPSQDVCQCKGSPLKFECEPQFCHPRSDAGEPDQFVPPPTDASDGATTSDARDARSDG